MMAALAAIYISPSCLGGDKHLPPLLYLSFFVLAVEIGIVIDETVNQLSWLDMGH